MFKFVILLLMPTLFFECIGKTNSTGNEGSILLNPIEVTKKYSFIDYLHSIEYIPVKDDGIHIRQLGKIIITDKYYFTKLGYKPGSIQQFDLEGKFVQNIRAVDANLQPSGFRGLGDLVWDPDRNVLYVSDLEYRHIIALDMNHLEDGMRLILDDVYGLGLHLHKDVMFILTNTHDTGLIRTLNLKTGEEHHLVKENNYLINQSIHWYHFTQNGDRTLVSIPWNDTIYTITDNTATPAFVIADCTRTIRDPGLDMNEYLMTLANIHQSPLNKYIFPDGVIWSVNGHLHIDMTNWTRLFIDAHTGQSYLAYLKDELASYYLFHKNVLIRGVCEQGYLYTTVLLDEDFYTQAHLFLSKHNDSHPLTGPLSGLLNEYPPEREFQNPVIVKYKLKENFMDVLR